mgnify:FL=1|jgi:hypothetical protein|tara:strand:+ start:830 stop:1030 length:201 start_codon:yes stop_codon:yes gene_type:complete
MTPTKFILLMLSFGTVSVIIMFFKSKSAKQKVLEWLETIFITLLWIMIIPLALIFKLFEKDKNEKN